MGKLRIKRHKHGIVAYATSVAAAGNITGLTRDPSAACLFTAELAAMVKVYYRDRSGFGLLSFEDEASHPAEPASETDVLRKQRDAYAAEATKLGDERDLLLLQIGQPPEGSQPDEARPRGRTWHEERATWQTEVAALQARIAVLEEAATKPSSEGQKARK